MIGREAPTMEVDKKTWESTGPPHSGTSHVSIGTLSCPYIKTPSSQNQRLGIPWRHPRGLLVDKKEIKKRDVQSHSPASISGRQEAGRRQARCFGHLDLSCCTRAPSSPPVMLGVHRVRTCCARALDRSRHPWAYMSTLSVCCTHPGGVSSGAGCYIWQDQL